MSKYNRINWQTGMEITPQVLIDADNFHIERQNFIWRLQVMPCYGLLPESNFQANISLEGDTLTIKNLVVNAITPQGELIEMNEHGRKYVINDLNQIIYQSYIALPNFQIVENPLDNTFCVPIAKINNNNNLDYNYIPPCVSINSNQNLVKIYVEICNITTIIMTQIKGQEKYKAISLPLSMLELELKNYSKFESPDQLFILVKKMALLFSETLEIENIAKFLNETYCHTEIYKMFSIVLECLRELEVKTKKEKTVKAKLIRI